MTKVTYYRGSVIDINEIIEETILDTKFSMGNKDINKEVYRLIKKYYRDKSYYNRGIALSPDGFDEGYVIDFGSYSEFIRIEPVE